MAVSGYFIRRTVAQNASGVASSVAGLASLSLADGQVVVTTGYYSAGDGGGNVYTYNGSGRPTADGGFYINGPGLDDYFEAVDKTVVNLRQFGCVGDGVTDETGLIRAAFDVAVANSIPVFVPVGEFLTDLDYSPTGDLTITGEPGSVILGQYETPYFSSFIIVPEDYTGAIRLENIHIKDFWKAIQFSTWTSGSASNIESIEIENCTFTLSDNVGGSSGFVFGDGSFKPDHHIETFKILDSFFSIANGNASRHFNLGNAIDALVVDGCEFVGGSSGVTWIPSTSTTYKLAQNYSLPSPRITNNIFRDLIAGAATCGFIRISAIDGIISGNTFRNIDSNGFATVAAIYSQSINTKVTNNTFEDCFCDGLGIIYHKGSGPYTGGLSQVSRTSNIATVITAVEHNFTTSDVVNVSDVATTGFNAQDVTITVIDDVTFTYPNTGADVGLTNELAGMVAKEDFRIGDNTLIQGNSFSQSSLASGRNCGSPIYSAGRVTVADNVFNGIYCGTNDAIIKLTSTTESPVESVIVKGNVFSKCWMASQGVINLWDASKDVLIEGNIFKTGVAGRTAWMIRLQGVSSATYDNIAIIRNTMIDDSGGSQTMVYVGNGSNSIAITNLEISDNQMFECDNSDYFYQFAAGSGTCTVHNFTMRNNKTDVQLETRLRFDNVSTGSLTYTGTELVKDNRTAVSRYVTAGSQTLRPGFEDVSIDSSGGAVSITVTDGNYVGQRLVVSMVVGGTNSTVTVNNHETSSPEIFTFSGVGQYVELMWVGSVWVTINATAAV